MNGFKNTVQKCKYSWIVMIIIIFYLPLALPLLPPNDLTEPLIFYQLMPTKEFWWARQRGVWMWKQRNRGGLWVIKIGWRWRGLCRGWVGQLDMKQSQHVIEAHSISYLCVKIVIVKFWKQSSPIFIIHLSGTINVEIVNLILKIPLPITQCRLF